MPEKTAPTRRNADNQVVDINSVVDLDLDVDDDSPDYPPFRVRVGGQTFELQQPDAGLAMEIESARTTEVAMALMFDEQWPDARPKLQGKKPDVLIKLAQDYGKHFDLDEHAMRQVVATAAPNRAERRRRTRRR